MKKISLDEKFALFDEHWRPKIIAALNGQEGHVSGSRGDAGARRMRGGAARHRASHLRRPGSLDFVL
jgi:hypothetical protein